MSDQRLQATMPTTLTVTGTSCGHCEQSAEAALVTTDGDGGSPANA